MSVLMSSIRYFSTHWIIRNSIIITLLIVFLQIQLAAEEVPRKVLVLYNSETEQGPTKNIVYKIFQTILNYYGILPEYRDVSVRPLPDDSFMSAYRGIITTFNSTKMTGANEYLYWLNTQMDLGRKVVIVKNLGATHNENADPIQEELIEKTFKNLGLKYEGNFTVNKAIIRYVYKDKEGVEFERKYPEFPASYIRLRPLNQNINVYLSLKRTDIKNSTSPVVFTSPNGGLAFRDFVNWQDMTTFKEQWYLNPFKFIEESLDIKRLPVPDPTTLNGLRVAFSHIDGDAFAGVTEIDKNKILVCAEIIRDYILKKYDFPITVSVVVADIDPDALGNKKLIKIAREIFRLPNIEPASHSYAHPFYWDPENPEKKFHKNRHLDIPGYTYSPEMEIDYSVKFINKYLATPENPCKIFLWSGECDPLETDIERCDALDLLNMNGGDTIFDSVNNSYTSVAPLYRPVGNTIQFHCGQANENILTNFWTEPLYGYKNIITTMEKTEISRRIKPIDIYYHFYSGQYRSSLNALHKVYKWVLNQDIALVFVSDYIKMVKGYLNARIYEEEMGRYVIEDYAECLTVRFDPESRLPDLSRCENVLGFIKEPQGLYVSLAPAKERAVIVIPNGPDSIKPHSERPYLRKASGWINGFEFESEKKLLKLDYKGFGTGRIEVGGMEPKTSFKINGTAIKKDGLTLKSDEKGILSINNIRTNNLEIFLH